MAAENLTPRIVFQDPPVHFSRNGIDHHTAPHKPAAPSGGGGGGFSMGGGDKIFSGNHLRGCVYGSQNPSWHGHLDGGSPSSDGSDGEDEEEVDDDDKDGDGIVSLEENNMKNNNHNNNNGSGSSQSSSEKGLISKIISKDGTSLPNPHGGLGNYEHASAVVEPELYCAQMLHGEDGSASAHKEIGGENGYGFSGRKEAGFSFDPEESLRTHLLDPITRLLMIDAMVLPCGHSFGSGGMQHVLRVKYCCKCSRPVSEESVRPNLALRSAVLAFQREEESQSLRISRRRDRFEQEKCSYDDPYPMDSRGKGVQFPFVVSDRVIIKGNKRTPQRFVGRVAVVTTQCLNGWYVVKTLDNADSVKVQYRSLAKVPGDPSTNMDQNKSSTSNRL